MNACQRRARHDGETVRTPGAFPMNVYVIDPSRQEILAVEIDGNLDAICKLIGFDSVDSDEIDAAGHRLFFDESCFIRDQPDAGRFKLDNLPPVAGRGVVAAAGDAGAALRSPALTLDDLKARVQFFAADAA
jgi:hypothetical protein